MTRPASASVCPRCQRLRAPGARICEHCGYSFEAASADETMLILRKVDATPGEPGWEVVDAPRDVGRTPPIDIALLDRSVSRHHARVRRAGGEFLVEDLNSKNGTYINDRKVVSSSRIGNGDRVAFGDVVLTAEVRSNPRSASATELPGVTRPYSDNAPSPGATLVYPDASTPPVRSIGAGPEVSTPTPQPGLAVDGLAALHRLEQDLSTALVQFEHNGGRETLSAILDRLARLEGRRAGQELEALSNWIPTIRTMLEIELRLFNAMGGSSSAGSAQRPRDELQSHTGQIERVSRS